MGDFAEISISDAGLLHPPQSYVYSGSGPYVTAVLAEEDTSPIVISPKGGRLPGPVYLELARKSETDREIIIRVRVLYAFNINRQKIKIRPHDPPAEGVITYP